MADAATASGTPSQVSQPETAPTADSSSLKPTQDLNARIQAAKTPLEVKAIIEENRRIMEAAVDRARRGETQPEAKKAVEAQPDQPTEPQPEAEVEAQAQPEAEAAPEAQAEEAPATEAADEPEAEEDDGGDGPVTPISGKRTHLRLAADDKVGRLAASYMKRNRDLPMEEAMARAKAQLGIKDEPARTDPNAEAAAQTNAPESVDAVDAAIKDLRAQRKKANTELNFELVSELSDKLEDLIQQRFQVERQAERKQMEASASYDKQFTASEAKAAELYPLAGDPKSEFGKRMMEVEAELRANGDPLYENPMKPLRIAQMVAAEMNIAPRKKGAPATTAPAKAVPAVAQAPKKQVLPSGSSKTVAPVVNQKPAIDSEVNQVRSINDLRNLRRKLGLPI
jgi:hypothetical protein